MEQPSKVQASSNQEDSKQSQTIPTKPKGVSKRRLKRVDSTWIKRAALTILGRQINRLLDESYDGKIEKEDMEVLLKAIEAARKLEKDENAMDDDELEAIAKGSADE